MVKKTQKRKATKKTSSRNNTNSAGLGSITSYESRLHECGVNYLAALVNPFESEPACVPHSPALPSAKYKCFYKSTITANGSGFAFVAVSHNVAYDNSPLGDSSVFLSNGTYAGTTINTNFPPVAGVVQGNLNSPYANADFGHNLVEARVVALGVRVRYIGTELDRSGRIVAFEHPEHDDLTGYGVPEILAFPGTHTVCNGEDRPWVVQTFQPKRAGEFSYEENASLGNNAHYMAIIVDGAIPNSSWEIEVYNIFEASGRNIVNPTQTYTDDGMVSRVTALAGSLGTNVLDTLSSLPYGRLMQTAARMYRELYSRQPARQHITF